MADHSLPLTEAEISQWRQHAKWQVGIAIDGSVAKDDAEKILRLCDTIDHLRREVEENEQLWIGFRDARNQAEDRADALEGKVLWHGPTTKGGPWNTYSFVTEEDGDPPALECRPGTQVAVVLVEESDGG